MWFPAPAAGIMEVRIGKRRGLIGGGASLLLALCVADAILGCNASVGRGLGRRGPDGQDPDGGGPGGFQHQNRQAPGDTVVSENPRHVADVASEAVFKSGRPLRDLTKERRQPNDSQGRPDRKDEMEGGYSTVKHALRKSPRVKAAAATYPGHTGHKQQQQQDGSTPVSSRLGKMDERASGAKTASQASALASATDESSPEIRAGSGTGVRFPTDEFLGFLCSCPGGCRTINATHGRLDDGGGDRCDKTGVTGSYGNRATCWWIINADPGTTVTLTKVLISLFRISTTHSRFPHSLTHYPVVAHSAPQPCLALSCPPLLYEISWGNFKSLSPWMHCASCPLFAISFCTSAQGKNPR